MTRLMLLIIIHNVVCNACLALFCVLYGFIRPSPTSSCSNGNNNNNGGGGGGGGGKAVRRMSNNNGATSAAEKKAERMNRYKEERRKQLQIRYPAPGTCSANAGDSSCSDPEDEEPKSYTKYK